MTIIFKKLKIDICTENVLCDCLAFANTKLDILLNIIIVCNLLCATARYVHRQSSKKNIKNMRTNIYSLCTTANKLRNRLKHKNVGNSTQISNVDINCCEGSK
jgi:hypothetical protein